MNLKTSAIWHRLAVLLAFHEKLMVENRDICRIQEVGSKIGQLTYLLEKQNAGSRLAQTVIQ